MSGAATLHASPLNSRLWLVATVVAVSLHLGALTAALLGFNLEPDDDATGAPAIEISLAAAAPRNEDVTEAPPGPLAEDAAATPPSIAESQTKQRDEPKSARTESEDAELTQNEKPDKPTEESHEHQATAVRSSESSASDAAAPPKSEAVQSAVQPAAPAPGADASARAAKLSWQKALMAHLNRSKRYPAGAPRRSVEVSIAFTLDQHGRVVNSNVKRSSGDQAFDDAALAMMKRADPVPAPPQVMGNQSLSFDVPVIFRADRK
jgi:TonB family protein